MAKTSAKKADSNSWGTISTRRPDETLANREVHGDQQLERSSFEPIRSGRPWQIVAAVVGILVVLLAWVVYSLIAFGITEASAHIQDQTSSPASPGDIGSYVVKDRQATDHGPITCYRQVDQRGIPTSSRCYASRSDVPVPGWYRTQQEKQTATDEAQRVTPGPAESSDSIGTELKDVSMFKLIVTGGAGMVVWLILGQWASKRVALKNVRNDTSDINQHQDDQHLALPEELQRTFSPFPDAGAHSGVEANSMISHAMLSTKGLGKVEVAQIAEHDIFDQDGNLLVEKGEQLIDEHGNPVTKSEPVIDERFGEELLKASGLPDEIARRARYVMKDVPYNPGDEDRQKLPGFNTVADLINKEWDFPAYEVQRPAGIYLVDSAPVNTMVLAITRAGKGQTYIEPTLDMWSREKNPSNMVINDPKGELLVKNYVPFSRRGYQVVQFNLIDAMKTDIYNPLGLAAEAAREGDSTKCALYVENIADVFFPLDGSEDPVWPNAANNAFKRAAYGLIEYYLEEERELREQARASEMDPETLEARLDDMWGKVSLYNCYQLFVQLTSKKVKNPQVELDAKVKAGEYENKEDEYEAEKAKVDRRAFLWEDKPEQDMLTLYFNATEALPNNTMRTLIANANNALRAMAGAEKMLASVYGIAITAMSFFTDPTISTLTSGTPSQNTDLGGASFPRRLGVRFAQPYVKKHHLVGLRAVWRAYADPLFTQDLGEDFTHSDIVSREGWARYYFKGIFPADEAWIRLELVNPSTEMLVRRFWFHFRKGYQTSLNKRHYMIEPVTGDKIVKDGVLLELDHDDPVIDQEATASRQQEADKAYERVVKEGGTNVTRTVVEPVITSYRPGVTTYGHTRLEPAGVSYEVVQEQAPAIMRTQVRYSEKPKAIFLVTPPHLMKYAKLILILVKQLVDLNVDRSYMTKSNQKPLYRTRFMLDELGNLQSEGHGIANFETMLSIGLGQEQQFTLILQTLQQLRSVYGESVDKIVQGNCLPLDAKIATPHGWTTMGEVEPGEDVLTPFGTTTTVTNKYAQKVRPVYRITLRDGSSVEACPDHLWPVERWKSSIKYLGGKNEDGKRIYTGGNDGKTTELIKEIISTEELKTRVGKGRQIDMIRIEPVAYPEADLRVDPYVLGAILGDGHIDPKGGVSFFCADTDIVDEIRRRGYDVTPQRFEKGKCPRYLISGVRWFMRELGVAGKRTWEKSVPEAYLLGSVEQRIDLLRGLMDTDGTISAKGEMEFCSSSSELAGNVQTLIRSLGGRVAINVKTGIMYTSPNQAEPKAARDAYRVQNIRLPRINPFALMRKAERWRDRTRGFNRVVSVEYVRDDFVQCIEVADERHLYLADDFIPTHNTSNIVFLKSTDDAMMETLEKMSGKTHRVYPKSKQITQDMEKLVGSSTEGRVTYTYETAEEPVISFNNMLNIAERNSMVFRAGDAPVWNRNETILPMSHRLLRDTIAMPGEKPSLQTVPTLSSALDFDVRTNQPDFGKMLEKRMVQAEVAPGCVEAYRDAYDLSEFDIEKLDPDVYADEVMAMVDEKIASLSRPQDPDAPVEEPDYEAMSGMDEATFVRNTEAQQAVAEQERLLAERQQKVYAGGQINKEMLVNGDGSGKVEPLRREISEAYQRTRVALERDDEHFMVGGNGELLSVDGSQVYISWTRARQLRDQLQGINEASQDGASRTFGGQDVRADDLNHMGAVDIHADFCRYLASLPSWESLGGGEFEKVMASVMRANS